MEAVQGDWTVEGVVRPFCHGEETRPDRHGCPGPLPSCREPPVVGTWRPLRLSNQTHLQVYYESAENALLLLYDPS